MGLTPVKLSDTLKHTFRLFFFIALANFVIGIILIISGVLDTKAVSDIVLSIPPLLLFYYFVIRVFLEEWLFRAFLTPKLGPIITNILFAAGHIGYGSISEIVVAFFLGVVLSVYYLKTKNLYSNYFAHLLYNLISYTFMVLEYGTISAALIH
ncbi:MAG: CPBP family intramembrane glutamic endopeptidase [archaeon]